MVLGAGATYPCISRHDRVGLRSVDVKAVSSDIAGPTFFGVMQVKLDDDTMIDISLKSF